MVIIMEDIKSDIISAAGTTRINPIFAPSISSSKFVSVFRIDGVPIIPPLMTADKRRQMQKLKEKAIKIEQRLEENRKQRYNLEYSAELEELKEDTDVIDNKNESSSNCSLSEHLIELDAQRIEAEKSYMLLSDILTQNENESKLSTPNQNRAEISRQTAGECSEFNVQMQQSNSLEINLMHRMQKLQKSETLIYDHRSNTIISPLTEDEVQIFQQQQQQINLDHPDEKPIGKKVELTKEGENANINCAARQKSEKVLKKIPSICIDPPTPIISSRSFIDTLKAKNSIDNINVNKQETPKKNLNKSLQDEISSDESFACMESTTNRERDLKTHHKVTNITSKILKFENFTVTDTKTDKPKCSNIKPPQRSATSPSLKPLISERTQSKIKSLDVSPTTQNENGLVRSNSFTLDYPSKALIEHIRQQQVPNDVYPTKRSNLFSMSATRDTVESKAKRVQKVDLKPRPQPMRLQLKPSITNITSPSSTHNSGTKSKRSPYEQRLIKPKIGRQLKKSVSGTTAIKQMKPTPSMPIIQTTKVTTESARECPSGNQQYNSIEDEHRQKFLELLAQQKREQQRMQQVFEEQQRYLLEQLTNKIDNVQIQHAVDHVNNKRVDSSYHGSVENSPTARSDCAESMSANSCVATNSLDLMSGTIQLPSLELSIGSSTLPMTSQSSNHCTPRRRLFSHDLSPTASNRSVSISSNHSGVTNNVGRSNGTTSGASSSRLYNNS
uniref:Centriolar coiled-coil protein n=1 Tax=Bactrocera latifrons TaxID=174628 RepID=A0A0K8VHP8_BACLA